MPALFEDLEERIDELEGICSKHGVSLDDIINAKDNLQRLRLIETATNALVKDEDTKKNFLEKAGYIKILYKGLLPDKALKSFSARATVLIVLYARIKELHGPKIDLKVKDAIGREWQMSTIQFDFNMSERFDITYTGDDGHEHRPYMVHRALLGSIERFFGVLIEHYAGAFPAWLAPEQVRVLPVTDGQLD